MFALTFRCIVEQDTHTLSTSLRRQRGVGAYNISAFRHLFYIYPTNVFLIDNFLPIMHQCTTVTVKRAAFIGSVKRRLKIGGNCCATENLYPCH